MKKRSMRAAINAKCKDCNYDPLDTGTWRQQIASCNSTDCSLHPFRPMPIKRKPKHDLMETHADA